MIVCLKSVLPRERLDVLRRAVDALPFVDGRTTAGWHARLAKENEQGDASDARVRAIGDEVAEALSAHEVFALAARPRSMSRVMISRYGPGMRYGAHVDDAIMQGLRSDLSFTVFLSDATSYDGGELVIERADIEGAVSQTTTSTPASSATVPATPKARPAPATAPQSWPMTTSCPVGPTASSTRRASSIRAPT